MPYNGVELYKFNVLTSNGSIHQQFNLTNLSEKSYGSIFRPTLDVFQIELTGVDSGGNQVRRIGGTGVQLSDVDLRLGKCHIIRVIKICFSIVQEIFIV